MFHSTTYLLPSNYYAGHATKTHLEFTLSNHRIRPRNASFCAFMNPAMWKTFAAETLLSWGRHSTTGNSPTSTNPSYSWRASFSLNNYKFLACFLWIVATVPPVFTWGWIQRSIFTINVEKWSEPHHWHGTASSAIPLSFLDCWFIPYFLPFLSYFHSSDSNSRTVISFVHSLFLPLDDIIYSHSFCLSLCYKENLNQY